MVQEEEGVLGFEQFERGEWHVAVEQRHTMLGFGDGNIISLAEWFLTLHAGRW